MAGSIARVGDVIATTVRQPRPQTLRLRIDTKAACEEANRLLSDPKSGWVLCKPDAVAEA